MPALRFGGTGAEVAGFRYLSHVSESRQIRPVPGESVYKRPSKNDEIEKRIAERDKLLARLQRRLRRTPPEGMTAEFVTTQFIAVTDKAVRMEAALARFLDEKWVSNASVEEIVAHARSALNDASSK